jgi:hypothetical protein
MKPVRSAARAMLASIFVISGARILINPDSRVDAAKRVTDRVKPLIERMDPRLPTDARTLVRLKAGADVAAGLLLATGRLTRPAAGGARGEPDPDHARRAPVLDDAEAGTLRARGQLPEEPGPAGRSAPRRGGHAGQARLGYRTTHAIDRSQRSMRRAVRTAKREAKIAAVSAATARKLPG